MASQPSPARASRESSAVIRRVPVPFKRDHDDSSMYILRVRRDIVDIMDDPPPLIYIAPEENDVTQINALVVGPSDTPYEGAFMRFRIVCPNEYPIVPPSVRFLTTDAGRVQLHPNLYPDGEVSLSIIGTFSGPYWSPAQSIGSLLVSIQSLLTDDPFYNDPYVTKGMHQEAANKYKVFVRHEVVRVAVCDAVESCLEDNSSHPAVLREKVLELFLEFYDRYEAAVRSELHLTGTKMQDPISFADGVYQHDALLTRLQDLKARVQKRIKCALLNGNQ
ncbi:ubiquitin-conjugating enzyme E2 Z-like [Dermacentor andersoni]|uniref:ubiquitin-conjugating enzyme E2 Z-like n=1 Tax=Dermacentor andersoni TaxID=34620 RepID=UPI002416A0F6|nr:ubiquitin-conjugating enzyme E2 Z-like [Dermacentor andersoni]